MSRPVLVSASILCADFSSLKDAVKRCEDSGVDLLHVDVMDGHFVPNLTVGPLILEAMRPLTRLPIEAHLMIEHPQAYIEDFIRAGADIIAIHAECYGLRRENCRRWDQFPKEIDAVDIAGVLGDVQKIRDQGKKAYIALNPGTPMCLTPLLPDLDGILVMSVTPGFARQKFMPMVLPKIQHIRNIFAGDIAVDGGINAVTAPEAVKAGANILATASYLWGAEKPQEVVRFLKSLAPDKASRPG